MTDWFDTRAGIERAIAKDLAGFNELVSARKGQTNLNKWVILGRFYLDDSGNTWQITEWERKGKTDDILRYCEFPPIMTKDKAIWDFGDMRAQGMALPSILEECPICLEGWTLKTCTDYVWDQEKRFLHEECLRLEIIKKEISFFESLFKKAEIPVTLRPIPNGYHSEVYKNPWFIAETEKGPIRIGWRKHVISIDWSRSNIKTNGCQLFEKEDVTKDTTLVHAWTADKAIEYLRALVTNK